MVTVYFYLDRYLEIVSFRHRNSGLSTWKYQFLYDH